MQVKNLLNIGHTISPWNESHALLNEICKHTTILKEKAMVVDPKEDTLAHTLAENHY